MIPSAQVLVNNYFGRQFNSLNDVSVNYRNKHIYFTDTVYGYLQDFRPRPGLPNQVYRLDPATGAVTVVADEFVSCNGEQYPICLVWTSLKLINRHHIFSRWSLRIHN